MTGPILEKNKRERTKLLNRAAILVAARAVFVELGYDAATVRDIVARTQLAPGTFYNYFPDKESVLRALVGDASSEGARRVREARARAQGVDALVRAGFRAYFEFIAGDRVLFALIQRNHATLRRLGLDESAFAAGLRELRDDLERAVAGGLLPPLPIPYLTRSIGAIALEIGIEMSSHESPDVDGATEFAAALLLGGLERLARGEAQPPPTPGPDAKKKRVPSRTSPGVRHARGD
jgi:AcrR family transcriptional regulator